jgi:hypothetical protein
MRKIYGGIVRVRSAGGIILFAFSVQMLPLVQILVCIPFHVAFYMSSRCPEKPIRRGIGAVDGMKI